MRSKTVVDSFPNRRTIKKIQGLPQASHDVTNFIKNTPEQIAQSLGGGGASLNVANADPMEIEKFNKANEILRGQGQPEIQMFGDDVKQTIEEINHKILKTVLNQCRGAFKSFIAGVPKEGLVEEYNTFIAPRGKSFDDVHSWDNLGVTNKKDPLRSRLMVLLDEVAETNKDRLEKDVLPEFAANSGLQTDKEKKRVVLMSMMSKFVLAIYYKHQNPEKIYGVRESAINTLNEVGKDGLIRRMITRVKSVFRR